MKVVLLEDVKNVGRIGDLAEVKAGYGRNFLIPHGLAELASPKIVRSLEFQNQLERKRTLRDRKEAEALAQGLQGATVTIVATVGANNRIHGQITNQQIAEAIEAQLGLKVDRHKIEVDQPIRSLGIVTVPVRITKGLEASITVEIAEEAPEIQEEPEVAEEQGGEPAEEELR